MIIPAEIIVMPDVHYKCHSWFSIDFYVLHNAVKYEQQCKRLIKLA